LEYTIAEENRQKGRDAVNSKEKKASIVDAFRAKIASLRGKMTKEELDRETAQLKLDLDAVDREEEERKKRLEEKRRQNRARLLREEEERRAEQERKKQEAYDAHIREVTSMELPLDWDNPFYEDDRAAGVHTDSIADALIMSLTQLGQVDIEYIAAVTGEDCRTVILALRGSIYQNPDKWDECFYKGWETAEEYLSGNLMCKLRSAEAANEKYRGYFQQNLDAIRSVLPDSVPARDIYVTLGSPWLPTEVVEEFIVYLLGKPRYQSRFSDYYTEDNIRCKVVHDSVTGSWDIKNKWIYSREVANESTFGTRKMSALQIMERTLNMRPIKVEDTDRKGKKTFNRADTAVAVEKQQEILRIFRSWVWNDTKRKKQLTEIFENRFSCVRQRHFDGSFLEFPTMSNAVSLYPYQKNAVARILFTPNTLLAHDVGAGKTYVMIAAGMELRRMGLSEKNMYVIPNNLLTQWEQIFRQMYPSAKLLTVNNRNFCPAKRQQTLRQMRDGEYDAILIAYSSFSMIPLSREYREEELNEEMAQLEAVREQGDGTSGVSRRKAALKKELDKLNKERYAPGGSVFFDDLCVTRLFVDEAHNFKNVPIVTKTGNVLGISKTGSRRCEDMMRKVHLVQKENFGGGVVMATGTPITNSITDIYVMQQYLQSGELALVDLQTFDAWVGMFAEKEQAFEIAVDTGTYRMATRFSRFHNLSELTALLASISDFHIIDKSAGIPDFDGYETTVLPQSALFRKYLEKISERADKVRRGNCDPSEDNMLLITTDGRKAALDLRLVNATMVREQNCKVVSCCENIVRLYRETAETRAAQLVFCDISTPKQGFNIYDDLKRLLVVQGIPAEEIAFVHDATTEAKKTQLMKQVNRGEIRVVIGSTFKLGLGVNIQERLIAVHHLDVPWRPSDMVQREGRILRQGNTNERVHIFRYIMQGSFDAYSWQLLETKQRFISELLSGSLERRDAADVDDVVLDYAEVKAIAVGNPLIKERVETQNELNRSVILRRKARDSRMALEQELSELPAQIQNQERVLRCCERDMEYFTRVGRELTPEERRTVREKLYDALQNNVLASEETVLGTYQGFRVVLPANMLADSPYVWLEHSGRYYVALGETERGNLQRIDWFLLHLDEHYDKLNGSLAKLQERLEKLEQELSRKEDYSDKIEALKKRLAEIDKELGVDSDD